MVAEIEMLRPPEYEGSDEDFVTEAFNPTGVTPDSSVEYKHNVERLFKESPLDKVEEPKTPKELLLLKVLLARKDKNGQRDSRKTGKK